MLHTPEVCLSNFSLSLFEKMFKNCLSSSLPGWSMETEGWASLTFAMRKRRVSVYAHMCVVPIYDRSITNWPSANRNRKLIYYTHLVS